MVLIILITEITGLYNYVKNARQKFYDLMANYPYTPPIDNWNLQMTYHVIKDMKCCGIDDSTDLPPTEKSYFYRNFFENCPAGSILKSTNPDHVYQ